MTPTGTLKGEGSFRLRPDIKKLPEFLAGVASVAGDLSDLVSAECVGYLAKDPVSVSLGKLGDLNTFLAGKFKHGPTQHEKVTDFEERFGVIIGDVTVSKLLPSEEVQKAMDGASEREALDAIVCKNLGYATMEEVRKAVKDKELTSDQVAYATENALAMTNNLHGMNLGRQTYTVKLQGDPGLVDAMKNIASSSAAPAIIGAMSGQSSKKGK
jgi:hypothetical protein